MDLATRDTDTAFAEVICADAQWLRKEFDALIAASFSQPAAARHPPRHGSRQTAAAQSCRAGPGCGPVCRPPSPRSPRRDTAASAHLRPAASASLSSLAAAGTCQRGTPVRDQPRKETERHSYSSTACGSRLPRRGSLAPRQPRARNRYWTEA
jgi:hypothetical protein